MPVRAWTVLCWSVLAGLALAAIRWHEPSLLIGVAVAAVWALRTGFGGARR
jgi:hypothetical protein